MNENTEVKVEALSAEDEAMLDEVLNSSDIKDAVVTADSIKEGTIEDLESKDESIETTNNEKEITVDDIQKSTLLNESTGNVYSKEEALNLFDIINRMKSGEKFSVYNALIPSLQEQIKRAAIENGITNREGLAVFANMIVGQLVQDTSINKEWATLQDQLKDANKLPQHMDIYGEALYKNMVDKMLFNSFKLIDKGEESNASIMQRIAKTYLDMYYFKPAIEAILANQSRARKYNKHISRSMDDLEYRLPKMGVSMSHTTKISSLVKQLRKNIGYEVANRVITAYGIMMSSIIDDSSFGKERAFLVHQFLCVLTYIDMTENAIQTDFGKVLLENLGVFNKIYDLVNDHQVENGTIPDEFMELTKACSDAYDAKYNEIKEAYDNDIDIITEEKEKVDKGIEEMRNEDTSIEELIEEDKKE